MPALPSGVPPAVAQALAAGDVKTALAALNARTGCRFTALYRFGVPLLHNLHFYDRQDPAAGPGDDLPVEATYCVYVRQAGRPFVMADALADIRADGHPKQREVRAYCGVPVRDRDGRVVGSLCHFDPDPVAVPEAELDVMESAAELVARSRLC